MAEENAEEITVDAKKWLADQQRASAEFFEKYYGKENGPDQPEAPPGQ